MRFHPPSSRVQSVFATINRRVFLLVLLLLPAGAALGVEAEAKPQWFKGMTHSHSFWSDGDQFPDMVVDWFKSHGYHFFCLSDHNVLMEGERWVTPSKSRRSVPGDIIEKYLDRFGESWVEVRGEGPDREARLKTFEEIKSRMEEPGRFLLIQAEEITDRSESKPVRHIHLNALNLAEFIPPRRKATSVELVNSNLSAVGEQAKRLQRPILTHLNHPNFAGYPVSARDLAEMPELRFVEICNNHNGVCHYGDEDHPSVERLWDLGNTLRLAEKKLPPLYGVATDDAHHYHEWNPKAANPGRGWIVVRAAKLETGALLEAMQEGDFYASTGVELKKLDYDRARGTLHVEVAPKHGTRYTIEFIGTSADLALPGDDVLAEAPEIGKVFSSHEGTSATYRLTGNELYVRAAVRSDRKMANPSQTGVQHEEAWTQPVGWEKRARR